jgi:GNAT superfamily N-acetyltransferase
MRWTQQDVEDMFAHVCAEQWYLPIARNDWLRAQFFAGKAHWYLSPVCTWPQWQGRGVGKKLLAWALERAERTGTPVYLRSAPGARGFYERAGFEEVEEGVFVRRGTGGVGGDGGCEALSVDAYDA